MARRGRRGLTHQQRIELWQRWKRGESLSDIGQAIGKHADGNPMVLEHASESLAGELRALVGIKV